MNVKDLQFSAYDTALAHGFWEDTASIPTPYLVSTKLALIHQELSEALDEIRDGTPLAELLSDAHGKPIGFASELADVIIRTLDLAEFFCIDMEEAIAAKMQYNQSRPYKHGRTV